jgi:hypothetical protein
VRTLCTARLVCSPFRSASSRFVQSVKLSVTDLRDPDTTLSNFPNLTQVTIGDSDEPMAAEDFSLLVERAVCDQVTHIWVSREPTSKRGPGPRPILPPLPNLTSMAGYLDGGDSFSLPATLHELDLWDLCFHNLDAVIRLPRLTSLDISLEHGGNESWEAITMLTALRRLEIRCATSLVPCLGALTLLTHLEWNRDGGLSVDLVRFTCLQNLVHLGIPNEDMELGPENVGTIAKISTLESLELSLWSPELGASDVLLLTSLSRLTKLDIDCHMSMSLLERCIETLLDLSLWDAVNLTPWGPLLQRATRLTRLSFEYMDIADNVGSAELRHALATMSRLQNLSLHGPSYQDEDETLFGPVVLLTALTKLEWVGGYLTNGDVAGCASLRKLRVLRLLPG